MSDNSEVGSFLAGFVIGGLVGAAAALVLAPQSGEETREQIAAKSRELQRASQEQVQHIIEDTRHRFEEASEQVQEQARIVLDAGKERAAQVREQVNTMVQRAEDEVKNATEGDAAAAA